MSDNENLINKFDYIKSGKEAKMVMIDYETNWVQFLQRLGYSIFYKKGAPSDVIKSISGNTVLVESFLREDIRVLGLIRELCLERGKGKFTMPLFAVDINGEWKLSCGNSRALANRICCVDYNDYEVVYVSKTRVPEEPFIKISTLAEFEEIFDIAWMDYSIGLSKIGENDYHVTTSIIRHTVYDFVDGTSRFGYSGERCYDFWARFVDTKQQIPITITCTRSTKDLIIVDQLFDVNWDLQDQCQFSFKWMLEKYQNEGDSGLYCLIDTVTESFRLHSIIPFMHRDYTGYHTEDKKLAIIAPYNRSSFQVIPNIVK